MPRASISGKETCLLLSVLNIKDAEECSVNTHQLLTPNEKHLSFFRGKKNGKLMCPALENGRFDKAPLESLSNKNKRWSLTHEFLWGLNLT